MHGKRITGKEVEMAKETRKENQKEISKAKTGRNHEILGMLKARQISREYNLSYSGVIVSLLNVQKQVRRQKKR